MQFEQLDLRAHLAFGHLVHFVFDQVEHGLGYGVPELAGSVGPLPDDVDERFGEDDFGAG